MTQEPRIPRLTIAGVARNCAPYLAGVFNNFELLRSAFPELRFVFVENDSDDGTQQMLSTWCKNRPGVAHLIDLRGLGQLPIRTLRLELARNAYLQWVKSQDPWAESEYLLVLDMDGIGTYPLGLEQIHACLRFLDEGEDRAAVFPNQIGPYYDLWACREPSWCPDDVWETLFDSLQSGVMDEQEAFQTHFMPRHITLPPWSPMREVASAFGGAGLYKMRFVHQNPNPYIGSKVKFVPVAGAVARFARWQMCEHVHFHAGFQAVGGRLFINPAWIHGINTDPLPHPSFCRSLLF